MLKLKTIISDMKNQSFYFLKEQQQKNKTEMILSKIWTQNILNRSEQNLKSILVAGEQNSWRVWLKKRARLN